MAIDEPVGVSRYEKGSSERNRPATDVLATLELSPEAFEGTLGAICERFLPLKIFRDASGP